MTPRDYVKAVRILGWIAIAALFAVAVVSHNFDGHPGWCPNDTAGAHCVTMTSTPTP